PRIATAGLGRARSTVATLAVLSIVGLGGCSTLSSWLPSWLAEPPSWPSWLSFGHNAHKPGPLPAFEAKATARVNWQVSLGGKRGGRLVARWQDLRSVRNRRNAQMGLPAHDAAAHRAPLRRRHREPRRAFHGYAGREAAGDRRRDGHACLGGQRRHAQGRDRA